MNQQSEEMTTSRFLDYLGTEIQRIQDERTRPGWTWWAILTGLAALSLLILQEWERGLFNFDLVSALLLAGITLYFCSISIQSLIQYDFLRQGGEETRFVISSQTLGASRFLGIYLLVILVTAFLLAFRLASKTIPILKAITYLFLGFYVFVVLVVVILSFIKYPFPNKVKSSKSGLFSLVSLSLAGIYSSINYGRYVILADYPTKLADIRFTLSLLAGLYLLNLLLSSQSKNPLLQNLISTRRDLALGRITIEDAREQAKVALLGLRVSDVLQEYISHILSIIEKRNILIQETIAELEEVDQKIPELGELTEEEQELFEAALESVDLTLEELDAFGDEIDEQLQPILRRIAFIVMFSDNAADEIKEILGTVTVSLRGSRDLFGEMRDRSDSLSGKFINALKNMIESREKEKNELEKEKKELEEKYKELVEKQKRLEILEVKIKAYRKEIEAIERKPEDERTDEEIQYINEKMREYEEIMDEFEALKAEVKKNESENTDSETSEKD